MASCNIHTKLERQQEQLQHDQQLSFLGINTGQSQNQNQDQDQQKQHIEVWRRTAMVSVQEMGFPSSEFSLVENKGGGGNFCWAGGAEANQSEADFFDEFVVLDGAEAASASTSTSHGLDNTVTPLGSAGVQYQAQRRGGRIGGSGGQGAMGSQQHLDIVDMGGLPRHYHETPGMGSISDSELLKLEGLSMRPPRAPLAATSASEPASSPSRSISPRKAGRLETLYTKAKAKVATLQGKGKQHQRPPVTRPAPVLQAPVMSTALMGTSKPTSRRRPYNLNIEKANAPLSSPPRNSAAEGNSAMTSHGGIQLDLGAAHGFFSGYGGAGIPSTPLDTPALDSARTTAASSASFTNPVPDTSGLLYDTTMGNGMEMDIDHPDFFTTPTSYKTDLQLALQQLQQQGYAPETLHDAAALSLSGLMIHMPQPRGSAPYVLHPSLQLAAAQAQQARFHYPPPPLPQVTATAAAARPGRGQDPNPSPRRPKPRAPSSGARHHYHASGAPSAMAPSTPRKARTASGSGSVPTTPTTATGPPSRLHRRSASMQALRTTATDTATPSSSIRKRKSWTGRRVSSSQHDPSLSASLTLDGSPRKPHASHQQRRISTARTSTTSRSSGAAAAADIENFERDKEIGGFVNYTPDDHRVLMTGVAPSGSSKTKARREREAAEAKRKTLEAVRHVVAAAGGDVSKLDMEGAWLDGRRV